MACWALLKLLSSPCERNIWWCAAGMGMLFACEGTLQLCASASKFAVCLDVCCSRAYHLMLMRAMSTQLLQVSGSSNCLVCCSAPEQDLVRMWQQQRSSMKASLAPQHNSCRQLKMFALFSLCADFPNIQSVKVLLDRATGRGKGTAFLVRTEHTTRAGMSVLGIAHGAVSAIHDQTRGSVGWSLPAW